MEAFELLSQALSGRYRLVRQLGQGGMAVVYLADDLKHHRQVAVKLLRQELAASVGTERFEREISLAAGLQHPHILPLIDSGAIATELGTLLYYIMPFVEGESLRSRLDKDAQLPVEVALDLAREILAGLEHAHALGIVHRDIKPANILLSGGHALIADFGVALPLAQDSEARITETGLAVGTAAYMSPEQAAGERNADQRSDLYSVGCVLYEMLIGEPPFYARTAQAMLAKRLTEATPSMHRLRETVPVELDQVLARALAKYPADRFASAAEFRAALRTGGPSPMSAPAPVPPPAPLRRARKLAWLAVALVCAAVAVISGVRLRRGAIHGGPQRLALTDLTAGAGDPTIDYLRSGIPEYLVSALRRLPGLDVVPMSLVRGESAASSPVELGRALNVTAVLTGTLSRFGGTLSINPELVEVASGRLLWSGRFEYPDTDYVGLIPAVVGAIADSLQLQFPEGNRGDAIAGSTIDPVALDLLLRARHIWNRGAAGAPGDSATVDSARILYQRVLERLPRNAEAIAGLGAYYRISFIRGWAVPEVPAQELQARGDSLIGLALAIDSTTLPAWLGLVIHRLYLSDDFEGARDGVERMIVLDPGAVESRRLRGVIRQELDGDLDGAISDFQKAVELDPSLLALNSLASGLMAARRYPEAVAALERSMGIRPSAGAWTRLITAYERLGRHADATRVRRLVDASGGGAAPFEAALAAGDTAAYARARRAEIRRTADSLIARLSRADVTPSERYNVAELRIGALLCELGDSRKAMDLVEDLYHIRPRRLRWIVTNPDLGCLRQDPRYLPMVKAAGLERYLRN
ncbi:MAG TPA: protein kinase [Gemmatimonadales bacterium]|nr:protein kinase [Gemmatimonadales bacterium]